jgi:hypothetical protein
MKGDRASRLVSIPDRDFDELAPQIIDDGTDP